MFHALTREPGPRLGHCQLTHLARQPIDAARAQAQHRAYEKALLSFGCAVEHLAPQPDLPDAVFVEDSAVVLPELAVLTRPGAPSRRAEIASVAAVLREHRPLHSITAPATLDGGDVLRLGRTLYVGRKDPHGRTNAAGAAQLRAIVRVYGYEVVEVTVRGCLHLKSAVTDLADDTILLNPEWVSEADFAVPRNLSVNPAEAHGANVLRVGKDILCAAAYPRTNARLEAAGFDLTVMDVSELAKAEGALTCCSLVFQV